MFTSFGQSLIRRRWWIVAAWAVGAIALAVFAPCPDPAATELETMLPGDSASVIASAELARHFPRSAGLSQAVVVIERRGGPRPSAPAGLTEADMSALNALAARLRASLPEAFARRLSPARLSVRAPGDFPPVLRPNPLVSPDGAAALVVVQVPATFLTIRAAGVVEHVRRAVADTAFPAGLDVAVTGSAAFGADYAEAANRSHAETLRVTVLAVLVILLAVYRAPLAAGAVLATISVAAVVAHFLLQVLAHWGLHVGTAERIFVFVLLYGVGVDYSLLYLSRFRESLAWAAPRQAAAAALAATAPAILASSATDVVGLAMLSAARFKAFQTTGKVVPIALLVALAAALTLAPAIAAIAHRRLFWPGRRSGPLGSRRLWPAVARVVTARPGTVLAVALVVLAVPAAGGLRLDYVYDALTGLKAEYGAARGRAMAGRHWAPGQATPTAILLEAGPGTDEDALRSAAADLTRKLSDLPGVADVRSLHRPLGEAGTTTITRTMLLAADQRVRAEYLSPDGQATRLEVVLTDAGFSNSAMATLGRIRQACRQVSGVTAHLAGATAEMADIRAVTRRDFRRVAALVLAAVFLIVLLVLRDAVLSALMVALTVLGYLAALGITGWFFTAVAGQEGLDWKVEVFLFVVMLAVGVDYNIFLAARMAEERRRAGVRAAARAAVAKTGGIISSAGLIMAATLGSLMVGDISLLVQLGFAFAVGMLLDTFVIRPVLLPALAVLTRRNPRMTG